LANRSDIMAGRAFVEMYVKKEALTSGLAAARKQLQDWGNAANQIGRTMMAMGIAGGTGLLFASKHFANFDDQMRAVKAAVNANEIEFKRLTEVAKELGRTSGFAAVQVGELMLELGRAGFNPKQIEQMTESVLQLSRATGTAAATSAGIMSSAIRQFGLDASEAARVADGLTAAANMSFSSVEGLGESLSYAGPVANDFGIAIEDVLAILGTLGNVGIQGSEAGTALRRMLTLTGAEASKMGQIFGVAFKDAKGNSLPLVDVLDQVNEKTKGLGTAVRAAKFNEAFGILGITSASALGKAAGSTRQLAADIRAAGGIAAKTAKEMDAGPGGAFRRMMGAIDATANKFGEVLAPSFIKATEVGTLFADTLSNIAENNKTLINTMAQSAVGLVAGGAALLVIGTAAKATAFGLGALRVALIPASYAAGILHATLKNGGMAAGLMVRGLQGVASSLGSGLVSSLSFVRSGLVSVIAGGQTMAIGLLRAAMSAGNSLRTGLISVIARVPAAFNGIVAASRSAFAGMTAAASKGSAELRYWLGRPFEYFKAITPLFAQDLQLQISNAMVRIRAASSQAADGVRTAWTAATAKVSSLVSTAATYIAGRFGAVANPIAAKVIAAWQAAAGAISARASAAWNAVSSKASSMLAQLKAKFGSTLPLIGQDLARIAGYASSAARGVVSAFAFAGPAIARGLVGAVGGAFSRIRAMGVATAGMMGRGLGAGVRGLGGAASGIAGLLSMAGAGAGGMLGQLAMIVPSLLMIGSSMTALINPATLMIAAVAGGVYLWTQYSAEGKAALATVTEAFAPLIQTAQQTFAGIAAAVQAGNLALAGKIAIAGLKLALVDGMMGLGQLITGHWNQVTDEVGGEMGEGMLSPWARTMETMGAIWDQWAVGVVKTFTNAARQVIDVWKNTVEGIANSLLDVAAGGGLMGKAMSLILGVDVEAEIARGNTLNTKLGLNSEDLLGKAKDDVGQNVGATAAGLKKILDEIDRDTKARADNSEAQLPNWQEMRNIAQKQLDELLAQGKSDKDRRDAWDQIEKMLGDEKPVAGVAGGGADGAGVKGMLETKSLGATFSAAAAIAMGRGGAAGNPQERVAKAAEKQIEQLGDIKAFMVSSRDAIRKSNEVLDEIERNTKRQVAKAG
jgi:TP901 family phage tail tape measure protein